MKVSGSCVVAETLPQLQDIVQIGPGEAAYRCKGLQKSIYVWNALIYSSLLKDNFRHPDLIRIGLASKGEFSCFPAVPGEQTAAKRSLAIEQRAVKTRAFFDSLPQALPHHHAEFAENFVAFTVFNRQPHTISSGVFVGVHYDEVFGLSAVAKIPYDLAIFERGAIGN